MPSTESHRSGLNRRPLGLSAAMEATSPYIVVGGQLARAQEANSPRIGHAKPNVDATDSRGTKRCARCEADRPLEAFARRVKRGKVTTQPYCRPCMVAYHTEWRNGKGREKFAVAEAASKRRYPEREMARNAVAYAIRMGRLERGTACENEGPECTGRLEAHHNDYAKPLEVVWVCRGHHRQLDRNRQALARTAEKPVEERRGKSNG